MTKRIELKDEKLNEVNGGNFFTDAFDTVKNFCGEHTGAVIGGAVTAGVFGVLTMGLGLAPAIAIVAAATTAGAVEGELIEEVAKEF